MKYQITISGLVWHCLGFYFQMQVYIDKHPFWNRRRTSVGGNRGGLGVEGIGEGQDIRRNERDGLGVSLRNCPAEISLVLVGPDETEREVAEGINLFSFWRGFQFFLQDLHRKNNAIKMLLISKLYIDFITRRNTNSRIYYVGSLN